MKKLLLLMLALLLLCGGCSKMELSTSSSEPSSASESVSVPESESASAPASEPVSTSSSTSTPAAPETSPDDEWQLRLVNAEHPLPEELGIKLAEVQGYRVDARMAPYLRDMINAASSDGIALTVISGYRTFQKSAELYENEVQAWIALGYSREDAQTEAAARVAPAGTSEHHTGLAADIFTADWKGGFIDAFEDAPGGRWLYENCARFGFVLRYPKDKTEITGIDYEPWHFRFVGIENAKAIMADGLCLEEYVAGK